VILADILAITLDIVRIIIPINL
ncbi:hypothetical protein BMETH_3622170335, partial [methanotrophic bacterial endosymbiont of Bathymodiolus sp.]